jgi:hypothetical protein
MNTTKVINIEVREFLESLVYSLDVKRFPDGSILKARVHLEKSELYCSIDTARELRHILCNNRSIDGFYNIANLVKARGHLRLGATDISTWNPDLSDPSISLSGELFLDEEIKINELLSIAPFVEHVAKNQYSLNVQEI